VRILQTILVDAVPSGTVWIVAVAGEFQE
jgi:hypothetical protein